MKRKGGWLKYLVIILLLLVVCMGAGGYYAKLQITPISDESEVVKFTVKENSTVKDVLSDLEEAEIIRDDNFAYYYIRLNNPVDFKAGDFEVDKAWELKDLFAHLSDSKNIIYNTVNVNG